MEIKNKRWIGFLLIFPLLDMVSTYFRANQLLERGYSLGTVVEAEVDPILSKIWLLSGSVISGLIVRFLTSLALLIFILGYLPKTEHWEGEDYFPLLLVSIGFALLSAGCAMNNLLNHYSIESISIPYWFGLFLLAICIFAGMVLSMTGKNIMQC